MAAQCPVKNTCAHAGVMNSTSGKCIDCAGAWTGDHCDVYNINISVAEQVTMINAIANQSLAMLKAQAIDNPLCKQGNECAGWGAIERGEGARPGNYPIIELTYPADAPPGPGGKRCPKEVICHDYNPATFGINDPEVLSSVSFKPRVVACNPSILLLPLLTPFFVLCCCCSRLIASRPTYTTHSLPHPTDRRERECRPSEARSCADSLLLL